MNYTHIYYSTQRWKEYGTTNCPFTHIISKVTETLLPITYCLFDSNAEGTTCMFALSGTPPLPLGAATSCNNGMHSLFPSYPGIKKEEFLHIQKCHQQLAHSGCKLHPAISTSVDQWQSPSNTMMRWKPKCANECENWELISSQQE
jgi:hypothetical protein